LTPLGAFQRRATVISRAGLELRKYRGLTLLTDEVAASMQALEAEQDAARKMQPEDFVVFYAAGKITSEAEILQALGFNPAKANFNRMVKEVTYA
jgi:hypothetical protein